MDISKIEQSKTYRWIAALSVLYSFVSLVIIGCLYGYNYLHGYRIEWHKADLIIPLVNLFPGQKVRLDFDLGENVYRSQVQSVLWKISKGSKNFGSSDELTPTFVLPLAETGIYQLSLVAITSNGLRMNGQSNLYVINDKVTTMKAPEITEVQINPANTTPANFKNIQSSGAEVYSGGGEWKAVESISTNKNSVIVKLPANESIPVFDNQILFRAKASVNKLTDYGSVQIPSKFYNKK